MVSASLPKVLLASTATCAVGTAWPEDVKILAATYKVKGLYFKDNSYLFPGTPVKMNGSNPHKDYNELLYHFHARSFKPKDETEGPFKVGLSEAVKTKLAKNNQFKITYKSGTGPKGRFEKGCCLNHYNEFNKTPFHRSDMVPQIWSDNGVKSHTDEKGRWIFTRKNMRKYLKNFLQTVRLCRKAQQQRKFRREQIIQNLKTLNVEPVKVQETFEAAAEKMVCDFSRKFHPRDGHMCWFRVMNELMLRKILNSNLSKEKESMMITIHHVAEVLGKMLDRELKDSLLEQEKYNILFAFKAEIAKQMKIWNALEQKLQ